MGFAAVPSPRFRAAVEAYFKADKQMDNLLRKGLYSDPATSTSPAAIDIARIELIRSAAELQLAADEYVLDFDQLSGPKPV